VTTKPLPILSKCPLRRPKWRKKLKENADDLCCLIRKKGSGSLGKLAEEQKQQLKKMILDVLRETFSRHTQTGLGFMTMTPEQRRLHFRFTIFCGKQQGEHR
jgi:hypothetical protein